MKPSLYDLSAEGLAIFDMLEESMGELSPDLEARLDALMLEGPERLEAAAMVVRTLEGNATACEAEAQRLRERARSFEGQSERLKKRMTLCLDLAFSGKVQTDLFTMHTQKGPDTLTADLVPGTTPQMLYEERPDLVRVKMELDRARCVQLFKAGDRTMPELITFQEKEGTRHVRIK